MFQLTKSHIHPLTPDLAQQFRDLTPSPTERALMPARVKHLRAKADKGYLVSFHWAKAQLGDQWYRINGQHSATMLAELNGEFPQGLFVHLDEYRVADVTDLALLFRQFDDRKSGRNAADVAGAYQGLEPELREVSKSVAKLGIEGVNWHRQYAVSVPTPKGDDQYSLFHESALHRFLRWLDEVFSIKTPELRRVPVVACMYATFDVNEEESRKFWAEVARGGKEYEDQAPSTVLDEWLKSIKEEHKEVRPGDYYRGCAYAWRAHREARTIKEVRFDAKRASMTIVD